MKRIILVISCLFIIALSFSACATHEKCPAYGHYTEIPQNIDNNNLAEQL